MAWARWPAGSSWWSSPASGAWASTWAGSCAGTAGTSCAAPGPLADELLGRVTDPHSQPRLLGFTVLFALLFLFIYVAVYIFAKLTKPPEAREKA